MENEKEIGTIEFRERKRWLFLGLPWTFTVYTVKEDMLNVRTGFFKTIENDCYMYKVLDVKLETTLMEKIFKLGTIVCYTGDTTDKTLKIVHVKNSRAIKDFILEQSEKQRMKRRTLNTQNLNTGVDDLSDADLDN